MPYEQDYKWGKAGELRPSKVANDYLTKEQPGHLDNGVLWITSVGKGIARLEPDTREGVLEPGERVTPGQTREAVWRCAPVPGCEKYLKAGIKDGCALLSLYMETCSGVPAVCTSGSLILQDAPAAPLAHRRRRRSDSPGVRRCRSYPLFDGSVMTTSRRTAPGPRRCDRPQPPRPPTERSGT
jgi:hypothetical protein